jgi:hypothetical protein
MRARARRRQDWVGLAGEGVKVTKKRGDLVSTCSSRTLRGLRVQAALLMSSQKIPWRKQRHLQSEHNRLCCSLASQEEGG